MKHPVKLEELFARVLGVAADTLTDASGPSTIPSWDSMATMNLVAALEELHDITLSTDEIRNLRSLGAARDMLRGRGLDT